MTNSYRVCLILPDNNPHSLCFREVGLLLMSALKSNNLECDFSINELSSERINIILGYHLIPSVNRLKGYRYIPYQMEQLHSEEFPFSAAMKQILQGAAEVWDYSQKNIQFLKNEGIEAKHIVPGYHPLLELIPVVPRKTIDVLFYGSIGDRRRNILNPLDKVCKLKTLFAVYGEKRDKWIARSRINLNIHHYSTEIFEAVRISYLLNNKCFVITETSHDYSFPGVELVTMPQEEIVNTCIRFLKQPELIDQVRLQNYEDFKRLYPMTGLIKKVL